METKVDILLVTIPKSTDYNSLIEELEDINNNPDLVGNHKLGKNKPKQQPDFIGFVYNGEIRFLAELEGYEQKEFTCQTLGTEWQYAWYAVFHNVIEYAEDDRVKMKGFQGFKYHELTLVLDFL